MYRGERGGIVGPVRERHAMVRDRLEDQFGKKGCGRTIQVSLRRFRNHNSVQRCSVNSRRQLILDNRSSEFAKRVTQAIMRRRNIGQCKRQAIFHPAPIPRNQIQQQPVFTLEIPVH